MTSEEFARHINTRKEIVEIEFSILDKAPKYIRDFVNDCGSPIQQWLLEGYELFYIDMMLSAWVESILKKDTSSQP